MGILYIVATPIGNLEDITIRAIKTLFKVDYIACEDTRKTGQLLNQVKERYTSMIRIIEVSNPKLISYYDEVEFKRVPEIIGLLESDKNVALVSDSGTPLISDPGFKLVKECIKRNIKIVPIPGPSSVITALISSGLPPDQFLFLGYLPANKSKRLKLLTGLKPSQQYFQGNPLQKALQKEIHPTIIFFETPHRLKESLKDLKEVFGDIEIVICRELTKIHEEVWRGKLSDIINKTENMRGEFVILFSLLV